MEEVRGQRGIAPAPWGVGSPSLLPPANRNATTAACAWGGGRARRSTSLLGTEMPGVLFSLGIEDANDFCPSLLPPGPPPFIFSPIPACLFGVGLKGAGWTRTENDISTRTTQSRATRERGHMAAALTCLSRDTLAKLRIAKNFGERLFEQTNFKAFDDDNRQE